MRLGLGRAAWIAAAIFLVLFTIRFFTLGPTGNVHGLGIDFDISAPKDNDFELNRKNYASVKPKALTKDAIAPLGPGSPENERYEKVGSLSQITRDFDPDRKQINDLIATSNAVLQHERAVGLQGQRALQLGIGVPPDRFDAFVEAARVIGKNTSIEVVKNDKTNDYLQLKAKRQTLEKARSALEALRGSGGSTDERVNVQSKLTEVEQQIQDLGVSLGEFDTQNELCTVKFSLREQVPPKPWPLRLRAFQAFQHALTDYLMLGTGFLGLMGAFWIGLAAIGLARKLIQGGLKS